MLSNSSIGDRRKRHGVRGPVLVAALLIPLACPPTAVPTHNPSDLLDQRQTGGFLVNPYFFSLGDAESPPPLAPVDPPSAFETLPLWDLDATLAVLDAHEDRDPESAAWLRWTIAAAQARPATSFAALVRALASATLTPARLAWWRSRGPTTLESRDALLAAYESTAADRLLLVTALALAQWEIACPVAIGPDSACRLPGSSAVGGASLLVQRDPIAVERARHWTKVSLKLRRNAPTDDRKDVAWLSLSAELELAATAEHYEAQLSARMPDDLDFVVEDWRHDSGVPNWEHTYEQQLARASESRDRVDVFFESYFECGRTLQDQHHDLVGVSVDVATRVLLRNANVTLAGSELYRIEGRRDRSERRREIEDPPRWRYIQADVYDPRPSYREKARKELERCVELGTMIGRATTVVDACRAALESLDDHAHPPLREFVPEPGSAAVMQVEGLVGPAAL